MSTRLKIYNYLLEHGPREYSREEIKNLTSSDSWPRVLRQLKQDRIISYVYNSASKNYEVTEIGNYQSKVATTSISGKDAYRIRNRDGHRCQSCGKGPEDGVKLEIDHKIPVDMGGTNEDSNLWTLCQSCNNAKKAFYRDDFDRDVMKKVFKEKSGYQRLKILFENSPNKKYLPSQLQGISGIRDWTRSIRDIRQNYKLNIVAGKKSKKYPDGYYEYVPYH